MFAFILIFLQTIQNYRDLDFLLRFIYRVSIIKPLDGTLSWVYWNSMTVHPQGGFIYTGIDWCFDDSESKLLRIHTKYSKINRFVGGIITYLQFTSPSCSSPIMKLYNFRPNETFLLYTQHVSFSTILKFLSNDSVIKVSFYVT